MYLKFGNDLNNTKVKNHEVVQAILYRLKTGCHWRELTMKKFLEPNTSGKVFIIIIKNGVKIVHYKSFGK